LAAKSPNNVIATASTLVTPADVTAIANDAAKLVPTAPAVPPVAKP
jgi:hypothetical protein